MSTQMDLGLAEDAPRIEALCPGAAVLRGFALPSMTDLLASLDRVIAQAPLRHMVTPGGFRMSVAMTNCGALGWVTDRRGYRYTALDPLSGSPWPSMPREFQTLARTAAQRAGFPGFESDACLVNRYAPAARLTLHQDKDERDFTHPIVSVSIGLPATFQFGGIKRSHPTKRIKLEHGDVVVWGGPARLHHHGVLPLKAGLHEVTGAARWNLTFRRAG